ncbi:hypothetical protein [Capnocytophaga sputigena]|uniref:DUF3828 domain-containing protein n=1 Tax=Capnocytophaga sputigena TaxID=1019 RepID=A0AAX2I7Q7_CAPSP|nr:hypothetical protein [Capnocytophaga sputigena]ATA83178.1 hypothetical protein CGC55_01090 [Capnocytophaga sputigena]EEB65968.1 hypothetical protein CAPSP0001_1790 [Capnocytophaga sputigena ATCC 33612]SQA74136.1 Uncharacterised protein [Capnocytophaga sputigena]
MKHWFLCVFVSVVFHSCSQPTPVNQNSNITADNLVEEIAKQVKHYPSERIYGLGYSNNNCYFDMFINDIKVHTFPGRGLIGSTAVEVNQLLPHSGKYTISYKMYPLYTLEEEGKTVTLNTLVDSSYVALDVYSYNLKDKNEGDIFYAKYGTPNIAIKNAQGDTIYKFAGAGKTYYEGSFEVELEVPYQLQPPFATAQDLRKMDQKLLMTKLLAKYKEVWQIYKNRELDNIARLEYDSLKDLFISHYATPKTIKENWAVIYDNYKNGTFEIQPIENYKLEFFADGKLAALMLDTKDNKIRGNTVLWAKLIYENGEFGMPVFFNRYFYIPQGETEFKVY